MSEREIQIQVHLALSKLGLTMFRQNTGMAWIGDWKRIGPNTILIENARTFHAGLCVGSSDLIGFKPIIITPEMVGRTVAVFTAAEIKSKRGRLSKEQENFLAVVNDNGGIGFVANSEESAIEGIRGWAARESKTL